MRNIYLSVCVVTILLSSAGCATITPIEARQRTTTSVQQCDYVIGDLRTASVGTRMLRLQAYRIVHGARFVWSPNDFTISDGLNTLRGKKETLYRVRGVSRVDDIDFIAVDVPGPFGTPWHILLDADYRPYIKLLIGSYVASGMDCTPATTRFVPVMETEPHESGVYVDYEVIYQGLEEGQIAFLRRFRSPVEVHRFEEQRFAFDAKAKQVSLGQLRLAIHRATADEVEYSVIADEVHRSGVKPPVPDNAAPLKSSEEIAELCSRSVVESCVHAKASE